MLELITGKLRRASEKSKNTPWQGAGLTIFSFLNNPCQGSAFVLPTSDADDILFFGGYVRIEFLLCLLTSTLSAELRCPGVYLHAFGFLQECQDTSVLFHKRRKKIKYKGNGERTFDTLEFKHLTI